MLTCVLLSLEMESVVVSPNVFITSQVNGQRISLNKVIGTEGRGYEVFIGHLPRDMNESELLPVLMSVGQLCELRLMMNFSGHNRGFAFARFRNQESANNAMAYLNNFEIRAGKKIAVIPSKERTKLFVGYFPRHIKEQTINKIIHAITENIVNVETKSYYMKSGLYRCYSIVDYKSHTDACHARRALVAVCPAVFQVGFIVDWAFSGNGEKDIKNFIGTRTSSQIISNAIKRRLDDKTSTLASEMKKLSIGDTERKVAGRRSVEIYSCTYGSEGSVSPRSDDNFYQRRKEPCSNSQVIISSERTTSSQYSSPQMKYGILSATMVECQLCGPSCPFKKAHNHSKRVSRTLSKLNSSRVV